MLNNLIQSNIENVLSEKFNLNVTINNSSSVGGGCINDTVKIKTNIGVFFVKWNSADRYPGMFEAEAKGLQLLKLTNEICIPKVIAYNDIDNISFLVLEWIKSGKTVADFWDDFGCSLAKLHKHSNEYFGLDHDNYIGSLPQSNEQHDNWISFFIEERLEKQNKLALDNGRIDNSTLRKFNSLYRQLKNILPQEPPALLHGDIWSGNYMVSPDGKGCIIDPAVYYGHREMDIAMTQLFGGFTTVFYDAYHAEYAMENQWQERMDIYNLYPLMVHVNLFGGGYLGQVQSILRMF